MFTDTVIAYDSPCESSPCGLNAKCRESNGVGSCQCLENYVGDPYEGCRPECVINTDCNPTQACIQNRCKDPCLGICAPNAICQVVNHLPSCHCPPTLTGDAYSICVDKIKGKFCKQFYKYEIIIIFFNIILFSSSDDKKITPCIPSPCGPNSQCREVNSQAVCSCMETYVGIPPNCRPECTINSECASDKACINRKCVNPCAGQCGKNANCRVIAHSPMCSCQELYTGDPFSYCMPRKYINITETCTISD